MPTDPFTFAATTANGHGAGPAAPPLASFRPVRDPRDLDPVERRRQILRERSPFPLPHEQTFGALYNLGLGIYRSYSDEATRRNWQDALAMRRDGLIHTLLRQRQYPLVGLAHHLEPDDPKDEAQKAAVARLGKVLSAIPRFQDLKLALSEAIWFGKAGAQVAHVRTRIDGRCGVTVGRHEPVQGDKIVYRFDEFGATPGILVRATWQPPGQDRDRLLRLHADRGAALFLTDSFYRDRFLIHNFEPTDFDFLFEADKAAGVHGTGLRDRLYWTWWLRQELLSYAMDAMQRLSCNGMLYYEYESGNVADRDAGIAALKMLIRDSAAAFPKQQKMEGDTVKHIEVSPVGYDILLRFIDYLDGLMRRCVLGQDATTGGMDGKKGSGSRTAEAQESTFDSIKRFDAVCLAETLTEQLVRPLIRMNDDLRNLPFKIRLVLPTDKQDVGERAAAIKMAFDMQLPLSKSKTYEELALSPPEDESDALQAPPPPDPMAMLGGAAAAGDGASLAGKPGGPPGRPGQPPRPQRPPGPTGKRSSTDGSGIPGGANVPRVMRQAAMDRPGSGTPRTPDGVVKHARDEGPERYDRNPCGDGEGGFERGNTCASGGRRASAYEGDDEFGTMREDAASDWKANGVRSRTFKSWFGDWEDDPEGASKIRDYATGQPLVVYHGTGNRFEAFDPAHRNPGQSSNEYGIFLTPRKKYASMYGDRLISAYVDIRHPLFVDAKYDISPADLTKEDIEKLEAQGYDGIISGGTEADWKAGKAGKFDEVIPFHPDQVKSIDNAGTFDPGDARFRYARNKHARDAGLIAALERYARPKPAAGQKSLAFSDDDAAGPGVRHAPKGGVTVAGKEYPGGEFIPGEAIAKASLKEKAELKAKGVDTGGAEPPRAKAAGKPARKPGRAREPEAKTEPAPVPEAEETPEARRAAAAKDWAENGVRAKAFQAWFGPWDSDPANASKVISTETGEPAETFPIPGTGSKVRGPDGKPRVVYHGTAQGGFEAFDRAKQVAWSLYGPGFYFTEDRTIADSYREKDRPWTLDQEVDKDLMDRAHRWLSSDAVRREFMNDVTVREGFSNLAGAWEGGPEEFGKFLASDEVGAETGRNKLKLTRSGGGSTQTYEVYLNIRKPFDLDEPISWPDAEKLIGAILHDQPRQARAAIRERAEMHGGRRGTLTLDEVYGSATGFIEPPAGIDRNQWIGKAGQKADVAERLKRLGYDGLTHIGGDRVGGGEVRHRVWVAFEPNQVKAVDNLGTFDPADDRIRYARPRPAAGQSSFGWSEQDHPRGQPENAGEFRPRGSAAAPKGAPPPPTTSGAPPAPAPAKPAPDHGRDADLGISPAMRAAARRAVSLLRADHRTELADLRRSQAEELAGLRAEHAAARADLEADQKMEARYSDDPAALAADHAAAREALAAEHAEAEAALTDQHADDLAGSRRDARDEALDLLADHYLDAAGPAEGESDDDLIARARAWAAANLPDAYRGADDADAD